MKWSFERSIHILLILIAAPVLLSTMGSSPRAATEVILSDARFFGLTRVVASTNVPLTGLDASRIVITRPDGRVVPPGKITGVDASSNGVSVVIDADPLARITSEGTTIATRAFGSFRASRPVKVQRSGEPAANGHIIGTSSGLDEGWNSIRTDLDFIDPVTGEKGLYHITDVTPNRDEKAKPIDWKDGHIVTPAHKAKTMLMLLVEFPDRRADYTGQIISRKYYNNPVTGGPKNLTGLWRPIENSLDGYDSPDCCWQPGDVFSDPATGVTISVGGITHYDSSDPSKSPYTADDVATVTVHKTMDADLLKGVVLSNAQPKGLTDLNFDTNIELQQRVANARIREDSLLCPKSLVITKADGSIIPAKNIIKIVVNPGNVQVTLAKGAFAGTNNAAGATVATRAYYHFGSGAAVPVRILN